MSVSCLTNSSSVVELTADVNSAVEQLEELGVQLRSKGKGIAEHELRHIDEVIKALRELDSKRHKAHELLETETIKASILRHKLANFPHKLWAEMNALISSARESNAAEMKRLQDELTCINEQADQLEKTQEVLLLHNQVLEPEQTRLKSKHANMVKKLNACMGKKSEMQIRLNETRDKLSSTNAEIEKLENGMMKLQQDMVEARERFTQETNDLAQQKEKTKQQCELKKSDNLRLLRELNLHQSEAVETALNVTDKQKALSELEISIKKLMNLEDEMKIKLEEGEEKTEKLQYKCTKVEKDTVRMRESYETKKAEILRKKELFIKEQEVQAIESKRLLGLKKGLKRDYKQAQDTSAMQARALKDMQENVGTSKSTLLFQAEEGARLEAENKELSFRIGQLKESHAVSVKVLKDEISDMKFSMDKGKKTREIVEETYNALQSQIDRIRSEHATNMSELATTTSDSQRLYSDMCDKAAQLERSLSELSKSTATLNNQLSAATAKLHSTRATLTKKIEESEQNIVDMTDEITDRNETLSEIEPVCETLEGKYKNKDDWYESRKRDIIALKSKRSELEDDIKRIERELEKIHIPQEKLRMDALRCRAYTRRHLRERVLEVEDMEKKVVEAKQQLAAITNENERIEKASHALREETQHLTALSERKDEIEKQLDEALKVYKNELGEQWKKNDEMEKRASARDRVVLNDLSRLKNLSEERLTMITALHGNFDEELCRFTSYVETAASVAAK